MRSLKDLINRDEPAMADIREWLAAARNGVRVLPCEPADGERTLLALQVTTRSPMGALAYETGGLLVDHGWVRVLGAGCAELPRSITDWNHIAQPQEQHRLPGALLVGDDAVGGFFAVDGGAIAAEPGHVCYFAPDSLEWEDLELSYSDWLWWLFTGDLDSFYENARWPGWQSEAEALRGDQGISIVPFLWAEGPPPAERSRRPVPIEELWRLHVEEMPPQVKG